MSKNIKKGEKISLKNIKVVRPAFGLHPKYKKNFGQSIKKIFRSWIEIKTKLFKIKRCLI